MVYFVIVYKRRDILKKIKAVLCVVCAVFVMLTTTSCAMREFFATLGFDTHDYSSEKVIATHVPDSDVGVMLSDMVKIITVNSVSVPEFDGTKEATSACRDAVLNYLLNQSYSKYAGNLELLDKATEMYPQMNFVVIIPAEDFENTIYRYFGGKDKVKNASSIKFNYLGGLDAYVTPGQPTRNDVTVNILKIEETESAYRFTFTCTLDGETGDEYSAVAVKRSEDNCYFKYVEKSK